MGDPFSVASGAVGIISLGLQVCGQLVSYCQAYGDFEDDIQQLGNTAASLRFPLEQLRKLIEETRLSDPQIARDLEAKAMLLEGSVGKLQKKLDSCKPILKDFSGKVRTQMKKVTHFFRQDMLSGIGEDLHAIQQALQTALSINTFQKIAKLEAMQENALKLLNDLHVSITQLPARQLPPPALLQSLCLRQEEHARLIGAATNLESQIKTEIKATDVILPVNQSYAITSRRTRQRYQRKRIEVSFRYSSRLLNLFFSASLSVSTGAGGISLAPVLNFQALCANDSWQANMIHGFSLLHRLTSSSSKAEEILKDTIHEFEVAFMEGKASPSDMIQIISREPVSLIDLLAETTRFMKRQGFAQLLFRLLSFLADHGSTMNNRLTGGMLDTICQSYCLTEDDYPLVSYLLDIGGPLHGVPWHMTQKRNIQYILRKDEEGICCPEIIRLILRESVEDLRNALESNQIGPCDEIQRVTLLDYAIGWPKGVKLLLEFGANPNLINLHLLQRGSKTPDIDSDEVYESIKILINAGTIFGIEHLHSSQTTRWNSLIIKSMVERRKKLWEWACCCIPPDKIARFDKDEETIIDSQVKELHELLEGLRKPIPPSLNESHGWVPSQSVYHTNRFSFRDYSTDIFDELYASGFRDVDAADSHGVTPSMTDYRIEKMAWLASKGADYNRRLPHSTGTVAILWITCFPKSWVCDVYQRHYFSSKEFRKWEKGIPGYSNGAFVLHGSQDDCVCPCSLGGCTTLSAAFRELFSQFEDHYLRVSRPHPKEIYPNLAHHFKGPVFSQLSKRRSFQQTLGKLIEVFQAILEAERIIIRALTFEGLEIKHACCTEVDSWSMHQSMHGYVPKGKSDDEVNEILVEERNRYVELEKLVLEFDTKFTEFGLPIWEFLARHWQPRMVDYLSHRDPYDEEHHEETRKLGVDLEVDDSDIPRWIYWLGDQVKELDDEST